MKAPSYNLEPIGVQDAAELLELYHPYRCGARLRPSTYCWGVIEDSRVVAAYIWSPPHYGAARSACPSAPWGVLGLSRMVALPRDQRRLRHVSTPLRRQMRTLIDRARWPVLVSYCDEGLHSGHVYKCSGWKPADKTTRRAVHVDSDGNRRTPDSNGHRLEGVKLRRSHYTQARRWTHHACPDVADVGAWMAARGWVRKPIPGKRWVSGNQAHKIQFIPPTEST